MQQGNKIVMDTNIVISAAISTDGVPARIFELFLEKKVVNYTTKKIISEIKEVMDRPHIKDCISEEYKNFILDNFISLSIFIEPSFNENAVLEDESDNEFVNCALTAKSDIISGDKHLLRLREYKDIKIFGANEFLGTK